MTALISFPFYHLPASLVPFSHEVHRPSPGAANSLGCCGKALTETLTLLQLRFIPRESQDGSMVAYFKDRRPRRDDYKKEEKGGGWLQLGEGYDYGTRRNLEKVWSKKVGRYKDAAKKDISEAYILAWDIVGMGQKDRVRGGKRRMKRRGM